MTDFADYSTDPEDRRDREGDLIPIPRAKPEEYYRLVEVVKELHATSEQVGHALSRALGRAVRDGERLDVLFRSIGQSLSQWSLNRSMTSLGDLLTRQLTRATGGIAAKIFGLNIPASDILPDVFKAENATPFAKGGVVAAPTYFPLGGSASGMGVMGEAGAEAILPLSRDVQGRLGVRVSEGEGTGGPSIVFNIQTPDAESFLRSEAQIATMVARAAGRGRRGL